MEMIIQLWKYIFLFIAVLMTCVNISRTFLKAVIPTANFIYQAIGITGFIILQWLI